MAALLKKVKKSLQNQISSQTQSEKSKNWLDVSLVLLVFLLSDFIKKPSLLGVCFILCGLLLSLQSRLSTFGNTGYDGIYRFLRHPRYLGLACVLVGLLLQSQSLYLFVFTTLLFITYMLVMLPSIDRMRVIEVKFDYKAYQRQVAALLPGWPQGFVPNNSEIINNSQLTLQNVVASKYRPSWRRRIYAAFRQESLLLLISLFIFIHLFQLFNELHLGIIPSELQIKSALVFIYVSIFIWSHKN